MTSCIFDSCCGCIELKTGCLIIGYLNLIFGVVAIVMAALVAVGTGVVLSDSDVQHELDKAHVTAAVTTVAVVVAIILIILLVLYFTFTIVYLVGVHQNKRGHVKAYLVYSVIFLVLYTILFFTSFASGAVLLSTIASKIFSILLSIYFLLVIRSYYYKMNDASLQPAIYNTA